MNKQGISLITLIIIIVVVVILAAAIITNLTNNNVVNKADIAVLKNDIAVMQDALNIVLGDITLEEKEVPVAYMDDTYAEKVVDRVWINEESETIGKVYYKTSNKKFCIVFGKEENAKINNIVEVATAENVRINEIEYRYTEQELATHKDMELNWYVTYDNKIVLDEGNKITGPGIYKMTVNAGAKADWLGIVVNNLVVPEGASIEYSFETSDDLEIWSEAVDNIDEAVNSQYLRVELTLISNEKGESPSFTSARVKFNLNSDIIEKPILEDYIEVYFQGQTMYTSTEKNAKFIQIIRSEKEKNDVSISVPVIYNGNRYYLTPSKPTIDGIASMEIYVSSNGVDWEEESDLSGYPYIKVEITAYKKEVVVAQVEVNANTKAPEAEWITTKTEYYEADASDIGEWISIEADEEIPDGTRLVYSFTKSNDGEKWSDYNKDITKNGNSRYIKVKVEYQKLSESINNEAKLNELIINYRINGISNNVHLISKRPKSPIDILYSENETIVSITTKVENTNEILGVQYKVNDGTWSEKIYSIDEPLVVDAGSATSLWVATRSVALDGKTVSNPIEKTMQLEGLVKITTSADGEEWVVGKVNIDLWYSGEREGYVLQYKLGSGNWKEYTTQIETDQNITIMARMYNEELNDEIASNSKTISNIDKEPPNIDVDKFDGEYITDKVISIKYSITDNYKIDLSNCKYIFNTTSTKYEEESTIWQSATSLKSASSSISHTFEEKGSYYLHILATDIGGNKNEYVSELIDVKKASTYLFNEGEVYGYTWKKEDVAAGNTSSITDGAIYFEGTNLTWVGAKWYLKGLDLSKYSKIYMEVSTGKYYKHTYETDSYGVGLSNSSRSRDTAEKVFLYTKTSNLDRAVLEGDLGEYAKSGVTLYLHFSRWDPGCYVHKIWVE